MRLGAAGGVAGVERGAGALQRRREPVRLIRRAALGRLLGGLAAGVQIAPARAAHADDAHEAAQRDQPDAVLGLAEACA